METNIKNQTETIGTEIAMLGDNASLDSRLFGAKRTRGISPVKKSLALILTVAFALCLSLFTSLAQANVACADEQPEQETDELHIVPVYRLYNPANSEHLFTTSENEYKSLHDNHGWSQEGECWYSPSKSSVGVYRVYSEGLGAQNKMSHHYTTSKSEADNLVNKNGWSYDNNGEPIFYSAVDTQGKAITGASPVYRLYHGGLSAHHFTLSSDERDGLVKNQDWVDEDIGFYAYQEVESTVSDSEGKVTPVFDEKTYTVQINEGENPVQLATVSFGEDGQLFVTLPEGKDASEVTITVKDEDDEAVDEMSVVINDPDGQYRNEGKTDKSGEFTSAADKSFTNDEGYASVKDLSNDKYPKYSVEVKDTDGNVIPNVEVKTTKDGQFVVVLPDDCKQTDVVVSVASLDKNGTVVGKTLDIQNPDDTSRVQAKLDENATVETQANAGVINESGQSTLTGPDEKQYTASLTSDGKAVTGAKLVINDDSVIQITLPESANSEDIVLNVKDENDNIAKGKQYIVYNPDGKIRAESYIKKQGEVSLPATTGVTNSDGAASVYSASDTKSYTVMFETMSDSDSATNVIEGATIEIGDDNEIIAVLPSDIEGKDVVVTVTTDGTLAEGGAVVDGKSVAVTYRNGNVRHSGTTNEKGKFFSNLSDGTTVSDGTAFVRSGYDGSIYKFTLEYEDSNTTTTSPLEGAVIEFDSETGVANISLPTVATGENVYVKVQDSTGKKAVEGMTIKMTEAQESGAEDRGSAETNSEGSANFIKIDFDLISIDTQGDNPKTYTYDGTQQKPAVIASGYKKNRDYEVVYGENVNAGKGTVTIKGTGTYLGEKTYEFDIARRPVTIESGITVSRKTYDGTIKATPDISKAYINGVLRQDTYKVSLESVKAEFDTKDVLISSVSGNPTYKTVNLSEFVLGGDASDNYKVAETGNQSSAQAIIDQKTIKVVSGTTVVTKTYDGNTDATLDCTNTKFDAVEEGDEVTLTSATGKFASKDVAYNEAGEIIPISVTMSKFVLGGAQANNYKVSDDGTQPELTGTITQQEVTLEWGKNKLAYTGSERTPLIEVKGLIGTERVTPELKYTKVEGEGEERVETISYSPTDRGDYMAYVTGLLLGDGSSDDAEEAKNYSIPSAASIDFNIEIVEYTVVYHSNDHFASVSAATTVSGKTVGAGETEYKQTGIRTGQYDPETGNRYKLTPNLFVKNRSGYYGMTEWTTEDGSVKYCDRYDTGSVANGDLTLYQDITEIHLYANWTSDPLGSYWMAPSKNVTTGNVEANANIENEWYSSPTTSVLKTQSEIDSDIAVLRDTTNDKYESVKKEYEGYMNNDNYHLYTTYSTTSSTLIEDKYAEFRVIQVGAHLNSSTSTETDGTAITFHATHLLPDLCKANTDDEATNNGGWNSTTLRSELQSGGDIFRNFNTTFTNKIAYAKKHSGNGTQVNQDGSISSLSGYTPTDDKFWVLSYGEITGKTCTGTPTSPSPNGLEGVQYTWFNKTIGTKTGVIANPALAYKTRSGNKPKNDNYSPLTWLLRSPDMKTSAGFFGVSSKGTPNTQVQANDDVAVALSFAF